MFGSADRAFVMMVCLGLMAVEPVYAWGWFTHEGTDTGALDGYGMPGVVEGNRHEFLMASSMPDMAFLGHRGEWGGYLHDMRFAEILLELAETDEEKAMAYGVGSHIVADGIGHPGYVHLKDDGGNGGAIHGLTELCVDIIVSHDDGISDLELFCDSRLVSRASEVYAERYGIIDPPLSEDDVDTMASRFSAAMKVEKMTTRIIPGPAVNAMKLHYGDYRPVYEECVGAVDRWVSDPDLTTRSLRQPEGVDEDRWSFWAEVGDTMESTRGLGTDDAEGFRRALRPVLEEYMENPGAREEDRALSTFLNDVIYENMPFEESVRDAYGVDV
jgi:hypothetical protein